MTISIMFDNSLYLKKAVIFFFCHNFLLCCSLTLIIILKLICSFFIVSCYYSSGPVLMDEFVVWYQQKYPPKSSSAWLTLPESSFTTERMCQNLCNMQMMDFAIPRKDFSWQGMLLKKNCCVEEPLQSLWYFFHSGKINTWMK